MQIPKEHKPFYLEELRAMRISMSLMLFLLGTTAATPILIYLGILPLYNLLMLPVFIYLFTKERWNYTIQNASLQFKRYIMEPEFAKNFDAKCAEKETQN